MTIFRVGTGYKKISSKEHDKLVKTAMDIIEEVIEPLHYPKRGVAGEKYYKLEDSIIYILFKNKLK